MLKSSIVLLTMILFAFQPERSLADVQDLTDRANFIFTGVVQKLNASTEPGLIAASPSTVIVQVNEVLQGSNLAADVKGKEITVQLLKEGTVQLKQRILFFSNVGVSGKSLVVQEVSQADLERNQNLVSQVADAIRQKPDRELQRRLDQADLVVTGKVIKTRPLKGRRERVQDSEHDPEWTEAVIQVESTEKGQSQNQVSVYFPASTDIVWFRSPKFQVGQQGVFILRRTEESKLPKTGFTALNPLDFQATTERERIKSLLLKR